MFLSAFLDGCAGFAGEVLKVFWRRLPVAAPLGLNWKRSKRTPSAIPPRLNLSDHDLRF